MIETLRPSTLGEILDRTAETYRSRFLVFLGIAVMPAGVVLASAVAVFLFFLWMGSEARSMDPAIVGVLAILFLAGGGLILLPLCAAAAGIGAGALNHAAVAAFYHEKITIRGAYKAAWKRGWRYIWLFLLEALIIFVAPGVVWSVLFGSVALAEGLRGATPEQAGNAIGGTVLVVLLALGAYAVWMLLMLCLSFATSVAENASAWTALKRAIALSKGTRGRILVLYILGMVLRWGLGFLFTLPAILVVTLVPGLDTPQHAQTIGTVLLLVVYGGSFAVRAFTKPVFAIAQLLFYYDQRIRKEGFDIEWMMRQAGMADMPVVPPQPSPWPPVPVNSPAPAPAPELLSPAIEAIEREAPAPPENPPKLPSSMGTLQPGDPL
jgi:hypothetical protein